MASPGRTCAGSLLRLRAIVLLVLASLAAPPGLAVAGSSQPPTVSITTPTDGTVVFGGILIEAVAVDDDGIAGVQFFLDGSPLAAELVQPPFAMGWDTASVANGSRTLTARARDATGAMASSSPVTVTVLNDGSPAQIGQWGPLMTWPLVAVHMTLLPDHTILTWDSDQNGADAVTYLWDPDTNTFTSTYYNAGLFCNAHAPLIDGRILTAGGHNHEDIVLGENGIGAGIAEANIFSHITHQWTPVAAMRFPRGYPTLTTLPDGRAVILGGSMSETRSADTPELFDPLENAWRPLPMVNTSDMRTGEYLRTHLLPDGRLMVMNPSNAAVRLLDVNAQTWVNPGDSPFGRSSTAMYRPGRVLLTGGGVRDGASKGLAAVIDMTQAAPAWRSVSPMHVARYNHNLVVLPDGNVLAIGGSAIVSSQATAGVLEAEVWNAATETWTTLAAMDELRMYHSTALLLADGRVLVAGGGRVPDIPSHFTAQLYSPPYLFRGARPTISQAPDVIPYGQEFAVETPDVSSIVSVALIPLGSVTHTINPVQRYLPLAFTADAQQLTVTAPTDLNQAPPGYYMLFLVTADGIPSPGAIIRIPAPPRSPAPPEAFLESSGQVVMETEHYDDRIGRNAQEWAVEATQDGFSRTAYMVARPNQGTRYDTGYVGVSPELIYHAYFTTPGTYYVWVRGAAPSGTDDSCHAGLDRTGPASADRLSGFGTGWTWKRDTMDGVPATLVISTPGLHTLHLWMREDGLRVDKILLRTSSSSTVPSSKGPAESPRVSVTLDTSPPWIFSVQASDVTAGTATISWGTDEPTTSQVESGLTPAYGSAAFNPDYVTQHSLTLQNLASGTLYYFRVHAFDAAGNEAVSEGATFVTASAVGGPAAFQELNGQVVMEAEHVDDRIARSSHSWDLKTSQSGFAGSGYLEVLPNSGLNVNTGYVTTSPELVFNVNFSSTGTYYVWVRGAAPAGTDDSLHAGLDGLGPASADRLSGFGTSWTWKRDTMDGVPATLVISTPGLHTLHLWMREDGLKVDKLLLRKSSSATAPSGKGPVESPRIP